MFGCHATINQSTTVRVTDAACKSFIALLSRLCILHFSYLVMFITENKTQTGVHMPYVVQHAYNPREPLPVLVKLSVSREISTTSTITHSPQKCPCEDRQRHTESRRSMVATAWAFRLRRRRSEGTGLSKNCFLANPLCMPVLTSPVLQEGLL